MSELKKLTRLGSDTKKIAALLQAKAPKGHMLAYINPREAALLKSQGGSGKPHADTGILSFEEEFDMGPQPEAQPLGQEFAQYEVPAPAAEISAGPQITPPALGPEFASYQAPAPAVSTAAPTAAAPSAPIPEQLPSMKAPALGPEFERFEKPGIFGTMSDKEKRELLLRAGLGLGQGLFGAGMARKAAAQGQAGKQEMQQVASPYQQMGQQIQAQAQRGELTPAGQQSLQAVRAQAAQAAERRGGVGATQAMQQVEAFRQQLLQQQYDYGLKLSGIGDQIALGAIKTGMQADQYVNQLTSSYYNNIFRYLGGQQPAQQPQTAPAGV